MLLVLVCNRFRSSVAGHHGGHVFGLDSGYLDENDDPGDDDDNIFDDDDDNDGVGGGDKALFSIFKRKFLLFKCNFLYILEKWAL